MLTREDSKSYNNVVIYIFLSYVADSSAEKPHSPVIT